MQEIFDKDGCDITETTEWVSAVVKDGNVLREELVDADIVIADAECDRMAVELFLLAADRLPDRATRSFRRLMRLFEEHDDAAAALTMFLIGR